MMVGRAIRALGQRVYSYTPVTEDRVGTGPFARLKVALVSDYFTADCLSVECQIKVMTPNNYREVIDAWKPDLVFVESAFHGVDGTWRYELAKQSKWMRARQPRIIYALVERARARGIPTVFWNKDDGAFFEAFIDVASVFDHVLTTDAQCVPQYRARVMSNASVNVLSMPYQPAFHHFTGFDFQNKEACFVGSYYRRILDGRREFLDRVFSALDETPMRLNVYDRNHNRLLRFLEFRFPRHAQITMHASVPHRQTADIYKSNLISLNVNSITDSETMCSRRLLEILACGGIAVTNPSLAVSRSFSEYCHVISTREEAIDLFARLKQGLSPEDKQRAAAGAEYVRNHHTWTHRLEALAEIVNF